MRHFTRQTTVAVRSNRAQQPLRYLLAGMIALGPLGSAASGAVQCKAEVPAARTGYWSWRNIDGKQCWYQGKPGMDKANLEWPRATPSPAAQESASEQPMLKTNSPKIEYLPFETRWQ
jgi:hypothetical protein